MVVTGLAACLSGAGLPVTAVNQIVIGGAAVRRPQPTKKQANGKGIAPETKTGEGEENAGGVSLFQARQHH